MMTPEQILTKFSEMIFSEQVITPYIIGAEKRQCMIYLSLHEPPKEGQDKQAFLAKALNNCHVLTEHDKKRVLEKDRENLLAIVSFFYNNTNKVNEWDEYMTIPNAERFEVLDKRQAQKFIDQLEALKAREQEPGADQAKITQESAAVPDPEPLLALEFSPETRSINAKDYLRDVPANAEKFIEDHKIPRERGLGYAIYADLLWYARDLLKTEIIAQQAADIKNLQEQRTGQLDLLPGFSLVKQERALFSKKLYADLFDIAKIRAEHQSKLDYKLDNGLTLNQQLDRLENWVNDLSLKDVENYIKLFAYIQAVQEYVEKNRGLNCDFQVIADGIYQIKTLADSNFYKHFLKPKSKGAGKVGYLTRDKQDLLAWLYKNQEEKDIIIDDGSGKIRLAKLWIYKFVSEVETIGHEKEILFRVNTNVLRAGLRDYLDIELSVFDAIEAALKSYANSPKHKRFNKLDYISNYHDIIIKFYLMLKTIYNREGTRTKGKYVTNTQQLTAENLNERLGNLKERVRLNLKKRDRISSDTAELIAEFSGYLVEFLFEMSVELKWLLSLPKLKNGTFTFYINPAHFDRKKTAETLKQLNGYYPAGNNGGTN